MGIFSTKHWKLQNKGVIIQLRYEEVVYRASREKTILINGLISLTAVIIVIITAIYLNKSPGTEAKTPTEIFESSTRSVVELKASSEDVGESFGTAIFVDSNGTLVTNAHVVTYTQLGVVTQFQSYSIRLASETEYRVVELVKFDTELDIAVLKVLDSSFDFKPIKMGVSSQIKSGETVYAIGNSANYGLSISQGIVGIPLVEISYSNVLRRVIQCDITIAEGNSGGALLDGNGKLIGMTTFRTKDNAGNVIHGLAYCVPVDTIVQYLSAE